VSLLSLAFLLFAFIRIVPVTFMTGSITQAMTVAYFFVLLVLLRKAITGRRKDHAGKAPAELLAAVLSGTLQTYCVRID